jgi:hypothetical protein
VPVPGPSPAPVTGSVRKIPSPSVTVTVPVAKLADPGVLCTVKIGLDAGGLVGLTVTLLLFERAV